MSPTHPTAPLRASDPGRWAPLLSGDLAARAEAAVKDIAQALPSQFPTGNLAGGSAGAALFYAYLEASGRGGAERAHPLLDDAITSLGEEVQWPTFYSGFAGIAWTVEHLQGRLVAASEEDLNEDIDAALETHVARVPWTLDYDLVSGLAGLGAYALDRLHQPSGPRLLRHVLARLDETKTVLEGGGVAWHTRPELLPMWQRERDPGGYYNLGLAHGLPGVIAVLGQAWAAGFPEAGPLLEPAVSWLLDQHLPDGRGCCFGSVVSEGESAREFHPTRLSWCYGDLGLGVALLSAARATGRGDWEDAALEVLRASVRREDEDRGIADAGLCHGAAGNAHLYNRVWQATGDPEFQAAALRWFERALAMRRPNRGIGGFQAFVLSMADDAARDPWVDHPGLLEGATGVGLALLAGLGGPVPDWDRFLMVALKPGDPPVGTRGGGGLAIPTARTS